MGRFSVCSHLCCRLLPGRRGPPVTNKDDEAQHSGGGDQDGGGGKVEASARDGGYGDRDDEEGAGHQHATGDATIGWLCRVVLPPRGERRRQEQHDDGAEHEGDARRLLRELDGTGRYGLAEHRLVGDAVANLMRAEEADEQVGAGQQAEDERDKGQNGLGTGKRL